MISVWTRIYFGSMGRDLLKVAALILVNEPDRNTVVQAIRQKINYDFPYLERTDAFINRLIDELMDNHSVIRQHFFSGSGSSLQFQDTKIAEYVLAHMRERGQLVLSVHYSSVVQDAYIDDLYAAMKDAYQMLMPDSIPEIKPKMGANMIPNDPPIKDCGTGWIRSERGMRKNWTV